MLTVMLESLLMIAMPLLARLLILLVLVQRGRGGGLAGALGGMGGQSASAPRPATCSRKITIVHGHDLDPGLYAGASST